MFGYEFSSEEKQNILTDIIMIAIIVAWAFFINRTMRISGLYMDDLYMWSCFGEQSFRQYVFPIGSTRFRPVYWFAAWIELGFIKNHIAWIVPINIMINIGIAVTLYMFVKKLATSRPVALITGIMFITSRLAYYQIGQLLGLMESMALWLVLIIVWLLYNYMHEHRKIYYYLGLLAYFLVSFTHERYMVLIPMFFFVLIVIRSKDIKTWISPIFVVAAIQIIRVMTIGSVLPAGTGGTQVAATVTLMGTIKNIVVQILYIFGVNAGPDYLSGMPWENTPFIVKIGVLVSGIMLLLLIIVFTYCLIVGKIKKIKHINVLPDLIFLIGFIIGSVVSTTRSQSYEKPRDWSCSVKTIVFARVITAG